MRARSAESSASLSRVRYLGVSVKVKVSGAARTELAKKVATTAVTAHLRAANFKSFPELLTCRETVSEASEMQTPANRRYGNDASSQS